MEGVEVFSDGLCHTVEIDSSFFDKEVVMTTAYSFMDRFYVKISGDPLGSILVSLLPKGQDIDSGSIEGEFGNALLAYAQHQMMAKGSKQVREMIVYSALMAGERHG